MKTTFGFPVSFLLACAVAVCGPAWGDVPSAVRGDAEASVRNDLALEKGCGCADIARMEIFRTRGLDYTSSRGFADAIVAVASGASGYSPAEIPPSWRAVALEWSAAVEAQSVDASGRPEAGIPGTAVEKMKFAGSAETCAPALLYLASLEYRARIGNDGLAPVFPRVVRESTRDFRTGLAFRKGIRCYRD
jgi:hypothetical protein